MIVRSEQMTILGEKYFATRFRALIYDTFPEANAIPPGSMDRVIIQQAHRAASYGLTSERPVGIYVLTAWLLGCDFDQQFPELGATLNQYDVGEIEKSHCLERFAVETLRAGCAIPGDRSHV